MTARAQTWGDFAAIGLSFLCMIHCLALPVAASLLPLFGAFAEAPWVHWAFAATAAPIAAWTLTRPDAHGRREWPSHELETPVTVSGGLMLAVAHLLNWRCRPHDH